MMMASYDVSSVLRALERAREWGQTGKKRKQKEGKPVMSVTVLASGE